MCGILISKSKDPHTISSISHRGIEHKTIEDLKNGIYLTHYRLPIQTSVGDEWKQPYEIRKGLYLLFNGEIFNYSKEKFNSDTEYLVDFFTNNDSYEKIINYGIKEIQQWDGFWTIVLYDTDKGKVLTFTDPLGKKQLYVNNLGEIASEIKPLIKQTSVLDSAFIGAIYKWGYSIDERTPFLNIKRIKPNTIYTWTTKKPNEKNTYSEYFDFYTSLQNLSSYQIRKEYLRDTLNDSINNRLLSKNYKISMLLSGGLDSAIIGGLLVQMGCDVNWFTIDNGEDEFVQCCERKWNIKVQRLSYKVDIGDRENIEVLKEIYCKWNEGPVDLGSVIPQFLLFKAVKKESDSRIVISGDGSDELFGGYRRIDDYDSQGADVLHELSYYHLPRLDKTSMSSTIELRSPYLHLDLVKFAFSLPFKERFHKKILKDSFIDIVPNEIIERSKVPLKNDYIKQSPEKYRRFIINLFVTHWKEYLQ